MSHIDSSSFEGSHVAASIKHASRVEQSLYLISRPEVGSVLVVFLVRILWWLSLLTSSGLCSGTLSIAPTAKQQWDDSPPRD